MTTIPPRRTDATLPDIAKMVVSANMLFDDETVKKRTIQRNPDADSCQASHGQQRTTLANIYRRD